MNGILNPHWLGEIGARGVNGASLYFHIMILRPFEGGLYGAPDG